MFLHFKALAHHRRSSKVAPPARLRLFASLFLAFAIIPITFRQAPAQEQDTGGEVLRVRINLITVPLFVTDKSGRRINGLQQQDFVVRDNGRVMETSYFASGAERVALLFALDSSGSSRDIINSQREAALALFSRFGKTSSVAVMRFNEATNLAAPFSNDSERARDAFNFPAFTGRRTAIFDAAWEAVRVLGTRAQTERRIVVLISDGLDTTSKRNASKVISEALESGVSFYVIHLPLFEPRDGRLAARPASKGFRDLAEKTGGRYFVLGDAKSALSPRTGYDLAPVFQAIEDDLRGQYLLGYYPPEEARGSLPHRIEVSLANSNNKRLRVQTLRNGYILKGSE
jgi:VWFA-related protein